ncbi:hypothetical protein, partial [Entomospira entomophila]
MKYLHRIKPSACGNGSGSLMQEELRDRFVKLEVEVTKDNQRLQHEIRDLKSVVDTISKEFHFSRGELKSVAELYQLYHKLTDRIERDSEKRDSQHQELLNALSKKLDAG